MYKTTLVLLLLFCIVGSVKGQDNVESINRNDKWSFGIGIGTGYVLRQDKLIDWCIEVDWTVMPECKQYEDLLYKRVGTYFPINMELLYHIKGIGIGINTLLGYNKFMEGDKLSSDSFLFKRYFYKERSTMAGISLVIKQTIMTKKNDKWHIGYFLKFGTFAIDDNNDFYSNYGKTSWNKAYNGSLGVFFNHKFKKFIDAYIRASIDFANISSENSTYDMSTYNYLNYGRHNYLSFPISMGLVFK